MEAKKVVIGNGVRTAFGRFGGSLKDFSPIDLGAKVIQALLERTSLSGEEVEEVNLGICLPSAVRDGNPIVARQSLLKAGLPPTTVSLAVDRACCSSLISVQLAWRAIKAGEERIAIGGGTEVMSAVPYFARGIRWGGQRLGHVFLEDPLFELGYKDFKPVAVDAGEVALEYGITREDQDRWALRSQQCWAAANAAGKFKAEIIPLEIPKGKGETVIFEVDEQPRPNTTLEQLSRLTPVYGSPTVTAGNAPGLNDGASAALVMSLEAAQEKNLEPLAEVITMASVAAPPRNLATVPALAIKKALRQANLTLEDLKLLEINEAFAAVVLTSLRILADGNSQKEEELRNKTNVNGGAIAIGHPVAASGTRILLTLIHELRRQGGGYGAAAICGGLAQGEAVIVKV